MLLAPSSFPFSTRGGDLEVFLCFYINLPQTPMEPEINKALLPYKGLLGRILACVLDCERRDWDLLDTLGLELAHTSDA